MRSIILCLLPLTILIFGSKTFAQVQLGSTLVGESSDNAFGSNIELSDNGSRMAVGAKFADKPGNPNCGHVRVFEWSGGNWQQMGQDIDGDTLNDFFGSSLDMSADGNSVVVGSYKNSNVAQEAGQVKVFDYIGGQWVQRGVDIYGKFANDNFGSNVCMSEDGNIIAASAPLNDGSFTDAGHVRIFQWNGTSWAQMGQDIEGDSLGDESGRGLDITADGLTIAIGAHENPQPGLGWDVGHVRVFDWDGNAWVLRGTEISGIQNGEACGSAVSLSDDGNTLALGAPQHSTWAGNAGQVRVYEWQGGSWVQVGQSISGGDYGDRAGSGVELSEDGQVLAMNIPLYDSPTANNVGKVLVYVRVGNQWVQRGVAFTGTDLMDHCFVFALSAHGDTMAVGTFGKDVTSYDDGIVQVYTYCPITEVAEGYSECDSFAWRNGITYFETTDTAYAYHASPSGMGCDTLYHLDLQIRHSSETLMQVVSCGSYTWIDGNTYQSSTNTPIYIIPNSEGCDSLIHLDLTIPQINTWVTQSGGFLTSNHVGASYQWLDCNQGMAEIPGATGQSYPIVSPGSYAVEITDNGCVDTSSCTLILSQMSEADPMMELFPNPSEREFHFRSLSGVPVIEGRIMDSKGRVLGVQPFDAVAGRLQIDGPAGLYFIEFHYANDQRSLHKVLKRAP